MATRAAHPQFAKGHVRSIVRVNLRLLAGDQIERRFQIIQFTLWIANGRRGFLLLTADEGDLRSVALAGSLLALEGDA